MKIEPEWITASLGVVLAVGGIVAAWFRYGTRLTVLEVTSKDHERRLDTLEGDQHHAK